MRQSIIWVNEDSLRLSHPVFSFSSVDIKAIFIWDDVYFKEAGYSLKRLVFIYETLCELPIQIIRGDTIAILKDYDLCLLYIPESINLFIRDIINQLPETIEINIIEGEPFVCLPRQTQYGRFFQYWNKVEKTALLVDGGLK